MMLLSIKNFLDRTLGGFVAVLLCLLCVLALWQVFSRYVLNDPSTYTEELLRYIMIWMGFLGATCCFASQRHLALTLLESKLKINLRLRLKLSHHIVIIIAVALIMVVGGSRFVIEGMTQTSSTLGIPMGWVNIIIPLSGLLIIMLEIINIITAKTEELSHD